MAIRITEDGTVIYENEPNVERELFPNIQDNVSPEQITQDVNQWLEDHPEATTTVIDGSITRQKLDSELNSYLDSVDSEIGELKENLSDLQELADTKAAAIYETASGEIASFSDGADDMPIKSCVVSIEPIQEGTGDPSPENVRPISGRTGLSVVRTGKNICDESKLLLASGWTVTDGVYSGMNNALHFAFHHTKGGFPGMAFKPYTQYTLSYKFRSANENKMSAVGFFYTDGTATTIYPKGTAEQLITVTSENGKSVMMVEFSYGGSDTIYISQLQVEESSAVTAYEPYKGSTYSVNLETEAGTVYGGSLDIVSGKLTVDRAIKVFDGSENWNSYPAFRGYYSLINEMKKGMRQDGNCNMLKCSTATSTSQTNAIWLGEDTKYIYALGVYDSMGSTVEDFKTYLSEHNLEVVYPLETPTEIQLTQQEVRTLLGENNIWSDGGDMDVEYPADTKIYIDTKIAEAVAAAMA